MANNYKWTEIPNDRMHVYGWPAGMENTTAQWLVDKLRERLAMRPCLLHQAYDYVAHCDNAPKQWKQSIMMDWRYAAVERALRDFAEPRWAIESSHNAPCAVVEAAYTLGTVLVEQEEGRLAKKSRIVDRSLDNMRRDAADWIRELTQYSRPKKRAQKT